MLVKDTYLFLSFLIMYVMDLMLIFNYCCKNLNFILFLIIFILILI